MESLHSHVDPKFLPKAYGGLRPEYSYTDWVDSLVHHEGIVAGKSSVILLNVGYFENRLDSNLKSFLKRRSLSVSVRKQISTYTPFACTVSKYAAQLSVNKYVRKFMHNLRIILISFFIELTFSKTAGFTQNDFTGKKKCDFLFSTKFVQNIFSHTCLASCLRYMYGITHGFHVTCLIFVRFCPKSECANKFSQNSRHTFHLSLTVTCGTQHRQEDMLKIMTNFWKFLLWKWNEIKFGFNLKSCPSMYLVPPGLGFEHWYLTLYGGRRSV